MAREDGWAVYKRSYEAQPPVVCWEQASPQWVAEVNAPLPPEPGQPERVDDEYERGGTAQVFMVFEPLAGQRRVAVRARRTAVDFAHVVRRLVEVDSAQADRVIGLMDNLNTHGPGSVDEALEPAAARRMLGRWAIHHTPQPASWLHRAETELSGLGRQCLERRMAEQETWAKEVSTGEKERHERSLKGDGQFTTADARIKLKRLYPTIEMR